MPVHQVFVDNPYLSDLDLARQLGQRLWTENELQLDFTGIERVTEEFAAELCRTITEQRDPTLLHNALLIATMAPPVQATFFSILSAALSGNLPPAPEPEDVGQASSLSEQTFSLLYTFNPLSALRSIQDTYLQYVYTFQKFTNVAIADWVVSFQ